MTVERVIVHDEFKADNAIHHDNCITLRQPGRLYVCGCGRYQYDERPRPRNCALIPSGQSYYARFLKTFGLAEGAKA